jgi:hypothetical protein
LPALPSVAASEYVSMITSYGPFPVLLPADRDFRPALALSVFGGFLGLDRFYAGKPVSGLAKLATAGGAGIWWITDIVSLLKGGTYDKDRRRFTGKKKHLAIAWVLTGALFAGLTTVAVSAAAPPVASAVGAVQEVVFPTPAPVPTWATLADIKGTPEPTLLQVKGDRIRLTYSFNGPVFAYLQKVGDTAVPAESLLLKDAPAQGVTEAAITPGDYHLVVRTDGTTWTAEVEELGLHG